jgi:hypothetical protein
VTGSIWVASTTPITISQMHICTDASTIQKVLHTPTRNTRGRSAVRACMGESLMLIMWGAPSRLGTCQGSKGLARPCQVNLVSPVLAMQSYMSSVAVKLWPGHCSYWQNHLQAAKLAFDAAAAYCQIQLSFDTTKCKLSIHTNPAAGSISQGCIRERSCPRKAVPY